MELQQGSIEANEAVQITPGSSNHVHSELQQESIEADQMIPGSSNHVHSELQREENHTSSVQIPTGLEQPVKQESIPYYQTHRTHARALSAILDEINDEDENDCLIVGETSSMPLPLKSIVNLMKRENDIISGKAFEG